MHQQKVLWVGLKTKLVRHTRGHRYRRHPSRANQRVNRLHISGGSWEPAAGQRNRQIRRDTHDGTVPKAVFDLLEKALPKCPNLKYVVLEQLGGALETPEQQRAFQVDFRTMYRILQHPNHLAGKPTSLNDFQPPAFTLSATPRSDEALHQQQQALSGILEKAVSLREARTQLSASPLAETAWNVEHWEDDMLETARRIAQKWKGGWG